jgi:hypothetical protein
MRPVHRAIVRLAILVLVAAAFVSRGAQAQVSVGGVIYAQYQYNLANDSIPADSNIQHINNFDITRAYVNVTGRFAGGIYARVTADIFNGGTGASAHSYRLKYAYVAWTPEGSSLTYKIGEIHTPWLDWEEALWDYRVQGQMAMERGGYLSSSDFGVGVDGNFDHDHLNFQAGIYDGENYSGAIGDNRKDISARVSYRLTGTDDGSRVGGLRLTGYAQLGKPSSGGQRNRFLGMLSYRTMDITAAVEVASTTDSTTGQGAATTGGAIAAKPQVTGSVISAFAVYHFKLTKVSLLARVDITDPNTNSAATGDKLTHVIGGVAYQLSPNCRLVANLDAVSIESPGALPTAAYITRTSAFLQALITF